MTEGSTSDDFPLAKVRGSIIGMGTPSGKHVLGLKAVPSIDSDDMPASESRQRLYSEDDEEIRMAKAMAMAIHNNPHLKPEEVQKMMEQQFKISKPAAQPAAKLDQSTVMTNANVQPLPKSLVGHSELENDAKKDKKQQLNNPFANLQESMLKTQELAKQRFQEIVQGGKPPADVKTSDASVHTAAPTTQAQSNVKETLKHEHPPSPTRSHSMVLPNLQSFTTALTQGTNTLAQGLDAEMTQRLEASPVTFSSLVWKRRSGMGKYSGNSWERRKLVIRGNLLAYYKAGLEDSEDSVSDYGGDLLSPTSMDDEEKKPTWLEQAAINLAKSNVATSLGIGIQDDDPTKPRGMMDLVKEKAAVCASMGHSGAPTPFCLSIKVGGDTKWKLCFESHRLQMEWLASLTDLVVKSCVDSYNSQLLAAADPRTALKLANTKETWYPPPRLDGESGTKLWTMDKYYIGSRDITGKLSTFAEENVLHLEDSEKGTELDEKSIIEEVLEEASADAVAEKENTPSRPGRVIRETDVYLAAAIVNIALLFSHASSTTPNRFWHVATFANLGLFYLLYKQDPEETTKRSASTATSPRVKVVSTASKETNVKAKSKTRLTSTAILEVETPVTSKVFKPLAGSTTVRIAEPRDSPVRNGQMFPAWRVSPPEALMVRSHGYKSTKKKIPSPGSLYDCVTVDVFTSSKVCLDIATRVVLPKVNFDDGPGPKTWKSPDIFVISVSLPTEAPASVFAPSTDDGEGYIACMYYVMRQDTRDILRRITADDYDPSTETIGDKQKSKVNAVKLFEQWCRRAPNDPDFQARFKFVPYVSNVKECGLPGWMQGYNGKPILIKRKNKTGYLHCHPELSAMEFDVSLHPFPYVAKQAFSYLFQNVAKDVIVIFGFVVESRDDDELPECLIGLTEVCYLNPEHSLQESDVFAGTSPKSHEFERDNES
jgi:hypothetical protein